MGSPEFAIPSLEEVVSFANEEGHLIENVFTQPDRPKGRGKKLTPVPLALKAKEFNLTLHQPKSLKKGQEAQEILKKLQKNPPDIICVVAYGLFLPENLLTLPKFKCVNVHPSLLPAYRGPAPIQWAIANGEQKTGVTTMEISDEMDAGPIYLQKECEIKPDENSLELSSRLAKIGAPLLVETLKQIFLGKLTPKDQGQEGVSYCRLLKKEDGQIDWQKPAQEIYNQIRGFYPSPGMFTLWKNKILKIHEAFLLPKNVSGNPGTILDLNESEIQVATGNGRSLSLKRIQLEGGRVQKVKEFLNGHKISIGDQLGR